MVMSDCQRRGVSKSPSRFLFLVVALCLASTPEGRGDDLPAVGPRVSLRFAMEPPYEVRGEVEQFDTTGIPLWLRALERPEENLLKDAAEAFTDSLAMGYAPVDSQVVPHLQAAFRKCRGEVARRALAKALVAYDAQESTNELWDATRGEDQELRRLVWPALGRWQHLPTIEASLENLQDLTKPAPVLRLAIEVMRQARYQPAKDRLVELVNDRHWRGDLRLAAAEALGDTWSEGLMPVARELNSRPRSADRLAGLLAVRLLDRHSDADSIALLQELAQDQLTAVQAEALLQLKRIRPELAAAFALNPESKDRFAVDHPDANVRRVLIESTFAIRRPESIPVLTMFLDDPHPENRALAGDGLFALAALNDDFRRSVEAAALAALHHPSWRVLERAALLIAGLDHEPAAETLVALLEHPRGEVRIASAYALKEIAVESTLPAVLGRLQVLGNHPAFEASEAGDAEFQTASRQAEQLCEQLGSMRYTPAIEELKTFIPKATGIAVRSSPPCRATAIWALGLLHQQTPDDRLAGLLIQRLADIGPIMPEYEEVREASAYALGWMKSQEAVDTLRKFADRALIRRGTGPASAWGLEQVTGEVLPVPDPVVNWRTKEWFLRSAEPLPR